MGDLYYGLYSTRELVFDYSVVYFYLCFKACFFLKTHMTRRCHDATLHPRRVDLSLATENTNIVSLSTASDSYANITFSIYITSLRVIYILTDVTQNDITIKRVTPALIAHSDNWFDLHKSKFIQSGQGGTWFIMTTWSIGQKYTTWHYVGLVAADGHMRNNIVRVFHLRRADVSRHREGDERFFKLNYGPLEPAERQVWHSQMARKLRQNETNEINPTQRLDNFPEGISGCAGRKFESFCQSTSGACKSIKRCGRRNHLPTKKGS